MIFCFQYYTFFDSIQLENNFLLNNFRKRTKVWIEFFIYPNGYLSMAVLFSSIEATLIEEQQ